MQSWVSCIPPSSLVYKLNFDAAVFIGISALGFRAVVRSDRGEVMVVVSARGPPEVDNEEAEVLACRCVVELTMELGLES